MKQETSIIDHIRNDSSKPTSYRRDIAALAALGLLDFSLISLFQMGKIKELPDLPGEVFDTKKVNTAKDAVLFGLPDGVISLGGYAATMFLAMAATRYKNQSRLLDVALGGVVLGQAAGAAQYMVNMTTVQKKACIYCIAGAVINFAALVPLTKLFKRRG
ncbi:vitamin K epoxide reductase family protein [Pontibacter cellulosilyticus]|uniref:Vitamin K epoxide reductase family protein n=1 Tax=Pontibacter cellulosilyticus TaxID=1720253 RepID=A0A923N5F8_9BACT|nr:vitamin K epoxide reductase family protein [Pontibacter cellulosilyticus]MBC5991247.1 vitamin K epoxide reductase family protein [Pontibacter cellulosilyticus]